jgi:hypothetical protein
MRSMKTSECNDLHTGAVAVSDGHTDTHTDTHTNF